MFGASSGGNNLAGKSNADVASFFQSRFVLKGEKLDAQVLATALAVYVTNATLDNTGVGTQYGFIVGGNGVATATLQRRRQRRRLRRGRLAAADPGSQPEPTRSSDIGPEARPAAARSLLEVMLDRSSAAVQRRWPRRSRRPAPSPAAASRRCCWPTPWRRLPPDYREVFIAA